MGQYIIYAAVIVVVSCQASGFPLETGRNASACSYKGRSHADGEVINVDEPCLVCRCKRGALTCGLRICADMPDPPPPGCYVVHNANQCCPQLVCDVEANESDIEVRTVSGPKSNSDVCVVNGSLYAEGSALESADKCEYCYCIRGQQKCIKPKCAMPFEGCKPIYTPKSCCPTQYDCRDQRTDVTRQQEKNLGCEINGVAYAEGAMLSGNDSNCETCYCMKGQVRCVPVTCETEFTGNCEPVYKAGRCCPTSYICSKTILGLSENSIRSFSMRLDSNESSDGKTESIVTTTEAITESTMTASEETSESTTYPEDTVQSRVDEMETATETGLQKNITETTMEVTTSETEESTMILTSAPNPTVTDTASRNHVNFPTENRTEESTTPVPLPEDIYSSSPQSADDYDSYDYNEPRLPPSLPNLIIFPFVAADAVVKDEETTKSVLYDESSIKRVGTDIPFYKDYFSPPTKTEGGFIPKQPPVIADTYQEYSPKDATFPRPDILISSITVPPKTNTDQCIVKGHLHEHGELLSEPGDCQSCICYYGDVICHEVVCPPLRPGCRRSSEKNVKSCCGKVICDVKDPSYLEGELEYHRTVEKTGKPEIFEVTPNPFRDVIRTEPAPDLPLLMGDLVPIYAEHQTKKPVTVTYKNLIVDYYPDFLVTTTRDDPRKKNYKNPVYFTTEIQPLTASPDTSPENVTYPTQPTVTTSISDDLEGDNSKYPYGTVRTSVRPIMTVATQPSRLFDYYMVEEYKPKDQTTRRTRPVKKTTETSLNDDQQYTPSSKSTNSVKHKYSTKTKSKTQTTAQYKETQTKSTVEKNAVDDSFSFDSVLRFFFNTDTTTTTAPVTRHTSTRKTTKKDGVKKFTANPLDERVRQTTRVTQSEYKYKDNTDVDDGPKKHQSDVRKGTIGGLLKLAGCNIYGRMYRVGKIIAELSNPCLECVCTDFGVECNPLLC